MAPLIHKSITVFKIPKSILPAILEVNLVEKKDVAGKH
jgi:hypothetical protein